MKKLDNIFNWPFEKKLYISSSTALFFLILLVFLILKILLNKSNFGFGIDGSYYLDVARHIHNGLGLKTRVSLYHKAYTYFPHPTAIYPLWPIALGYLSKMSSLSVMAVWLPTFLYFLSLILAYIWANKIWPEKLFALLPNLNAGHFLVIFLGSNTQYFVVTSRPYTEGLAFVLLLAFLLRARTLLEYPRVINGIEIGVWLGVLLLTRVQLIIVAIAMAGVYFLAILIKQQRINYFIMGLASFTSMIIVLIPFWVYISEFSIDSAWFNFFYFSAKSSNFLSDLNVSIDYTGLTDFLRDRLSGFLVAFNYSNKYSYFSNFNTIIYLIPLAFVVLTASLRKFKFQSLMNFIQSNEKYCSLSLVLPVLFSLGSFFSIHLIHKEYFFEWLFPNRKAIPIVFLVFFSLIYLAQKKKLLLNMILFVIVFSGISLGMARTIYTIKYYQQHESAIEFERDKLVAWLEEKRGGRDELTIAISNNEGQRLAWRSEQINYHWVYLGFTTLSDYEILFSKLACDYLVVRNFEDITAHPFPDNTEKIIENFEYFDVYRVNSPKE
jgi:hypothetical protein